MDSDLLLIGLAVIAGLALIVVIALVIHAVGRRVKGREGSRLDIAETRDLDKDRRLVLVRRDNVEHLLLLGGSSDIVVESGIGAKPAMAQMTAPAFQAQPAAPAPQPAATAPVQAVELRPAPVRAAAEPAATPRPKARPAPQRQRAAAMPDLDAPAMPELGVPASIQEPEVHPEPALPPIAPVSGPKLADLDAGEAASQAAPQHAARSKPAHELRVPTDFGEDAPAPAPVQPKRQAAIPPAPPPGLRTARLSPDPVFGADAAAAPQLEPQLAPASGLRRDPVIPPAKQPEPREPELGVSLATEEFPQGPRLDIAANNDDASDFDDGATEAPAVTAEADIDDFAGDQAHDAAHEPALITPIRPTPPRMEAIRPEPPRKPGDPRPQIPLEPAQIDPASRIPPRRQVRPLSSPALGQPEPSAGDKELLTSSMSWAFRNQKSKQS